MLHDRLVMSWERSARKQRAWSIIHLILLQSITLHLLYIIWAATCHARPSSHSPMLESDRLPAKHHTLALTQARWQLQRQAAHAHAAPGCSDRHKYKTTSSFSVFLTLQKETNVMNVCRRFCHTGHTDENALVWRRRTHRRQSCRTLKSVGDKLLCKIISFVPLIPYLASTMRFIFVCLFIPQPPSRAGIAQ